MICLLWFESRFGKTILQNGLPPEAKGRFHVCGRWLELTPESPQLMHDTCGTRRKSRGVNLQWRTRGVAALHGPAAAGTWGEGLNLLLP